MVSCKIGHGNSHAFAEKVRETLLGSHFSKRPIPIVMEELHPFRTVEVRMAVDARIRCESTADWIASRFPVAIVGDEKIQPAIAVVVDPGCGNRPYFANRRLIEPGLFCDVGEGSIAVVAIELIAVNADDKQVFMTIVVVVANRDAHSITSPGKSCFGGDVAECPIAIVLVETIPELRTGLGEGGQSRAIDAEDIRPAVPIKIDDAQSAR